MNYGRPRAIAVNARTRCRSCANALISSRRNDKRSDNVQARCDNVEAMLDILSRPFFISRHETRGTLVLACRRHNLLHRCQIFRVIELRRNTHEVGQIKMSKPNAIHAVHRCNRVYVFQSLCSFDLADNKGSLMDRGDFVLYVASLIVILRHAKSRTTIAEGGVARAGNNHFRLFFRFHHRHHNAHGP